MTHIMDRKKILYSLFFLLLAAILLLMPAAFASAATTVGNNVSVGGTLAVTGVVTITADLDPSANNTVDIGAFGTAYNNLFVSSTASLNYVSSTSADLSDYLIVSGNTTIGNATSDTLTVTARLAADLDPNANNTIDLGDFDLAYNDVFASGTIYATTGTLYNAVVTSSIYLSSGAAVGGGSIIFEDNDGAGCSQIYTLNGAVVMATADCPD